MRKSVLVVEDDPDIRETVADVLHEDGYPLATAANGREALDILARGDEPPGLILLDLMMPIMNGWQFLEEVKDRDIPVVVMSAYHEKDRPVSNGALARRVAFVRKPIDLRLLLKLVEHYCQTPSSH